MFIFCFEQAIVEIVDNKIVQYVADGVDEDPKTSGTTITREILPDDEMLMVSVWIEQKEEMKFCWCRNC